VTEDDAQLFASAQFYRYQEVERFLEKQLKNTRAVEFGVKSSLVIYGVKFIFPALYLSIKCRDQILICDCLKSINR